MCLKQQLKIIKMIHSACRKTNNHTPFSAKSRLIWPFTEGVLPKHNECAGCRWSFSWANLVFDEVGRVLEVHLFSPQRAVVSGQGQAPQCVTATAPFPNNRHDLLLDSRSHGQFSTSDSNVGTPVNDTFRSTLEMLEQQFYLLAHSGF